MTLLHTRAGELEKPQEEGGENPGGRTVLMEVAGGHWKLGRGPRARQLQLRADKDGRRGYTQTEKDCVSTRKKGSSAFIIFQVAERVGREGEAMPSRLHLLSIANLQS